MNLYVEFSQGGISNCEGKEEDDGEIALKM